MNNTKKRTAMAVLTAGLSLAMTLGPSVAMAAPNSYGRDYPVEGEYVTQDYQTTAEGKSTGDTLLYITTDQSGLTTPEGAADEQLKVSIPVAIHYVADSTGNLHGPSNDLVKFVNHTKTGAVHVSKIAVENKGDAKIVKSDAVGDKNDNMSLTFTTVQGQSDLNGHAFTAGRATEDKTSSGYKTNVSDEFGNYSNKTADQAINPTDKDAWNIAQKDGALALNNLAGKIGGFEKMDPATDYQAGVVHWVVRAGARSAADQRDATVTVHYNTNLGEGKDCVAVGTQKEVILDPNVMPTKTVAAGAADIALSKGAADVEVPAPTYDAAGNMTEYEFKGWSLEKGKATPYAKTEQLPQMVTKIGDLASDLTTLGGKSVMVYAIYQAK